METIGLGHCRIRNNEITSEAIKVAIGFAMTCNVIYEIVEIHEELQGKDVTLLPAALEDCRGYEGFGDLMHKFHMACEAVIHLPNLPDRRVDQILSDLNSLRDLLARSYGQGNARDYAAGAQVLVDKLRLTGDLVGMYARGDRVKLDRAGLRDQALALLDDIRARSGFPEGVAEALQIKLRSVVRLLDGYADYSDDQIRSYIKRMFADLASEADEHGFGEDKAIKSVGEFALKACSGGAVAIGLIADVPAAYALLDGPISRMIEHFADD